MHLKHILVKNKFEAEDLLRMLKQGKIFEDLAKKFSTCSSAASGGDLGFVHPKKLDPDFFESAQMLKSGQISPSPVRTKFGYHLIKRES